MEKVASSPSPDRNRYISNFVILKEKVERVRTAESSYKSVPSISLDP